MDTERLSLSLKNLFGYLGASPTSRCISEGEAIINARHIITQGILERTATLLTVFALCLQTSALTEKPHEIRIRFSANNAAVDVSEAICSCKGGKSGRCKHVAAVLLLCTRDTNILSLPSISSTDLECYWKKSRTVEMYKAAPIKAFWPAVAVPKIKPIKEIDSNEILKTLTSNLPESALAKHRIGRQFNVLSLLEDTDVEMDGWLSIILKNAEQSILKNITPIAIKNNCCKQTYTEICDVNVMEIASNTKNDKTMWHKERQFRVTGSRCYALYTYALSDWETKAKKYFWPKSFKSRYTDHGIEFEDAARSAYKRRNNYQVTETGLIVSKYHPWVAYTPDGVVIKENKPVKLLEIKCPYEGKIKAAVHLVESLKYLTYDENNFLILRKKHSYYAQIQLGMAILNLPECDFVIYSSFNDSFLNIIVPFDDFYVTNLIEKVKCNYSRYMLHVICDNKK